MSQEGPSQLQLICIHATIAGRVQDCITGEHSTCQGTVNHKQLPVMKNNSVCDFMELTEWSKGCSVRQHRRMLECQIVTLVQGPYREYSKIFNSVKQVLHLFHYILSVRIMRRLYWSQHFRNHSLRPVGIRNWSIKEVQGTKIELRQIQCVPGRHPTDILMRVFWVRQKHWGIFQKINTQHRGQLSLKGRHFFY